MKRKVAAVIAPFLLLFTAASAPMLHAAGAGRGNVLLCAFSKTPLTDLERKIGRKFGAHRVYHKWDSDFPGAAEREDVQAGRVPFITWKAQRNGGPVKWAAIAAGKEDGTIRARASGLKSLGKPVLLSFHHEPENDAGKNGSAADYVAAFRHVGKVFESVGASNVKLVWGPIMVYTFHGAHGGPNIWYPGPEYVDYVGVNGYNWYPGRPSTKWRSFEETFAAAYAWTKAHGKPMAIAETGVQEHPKDRDAKAQWYLDALATMKSWPLLQVVCFFHSNTIYPWWVDSSPQALAAFKKMAHDPWMGGTGPSAVKPSTGKTHRVSTSSGGTQGNRDSSSPAIAPDGQLVAFESLASTLISGDTNGASDVFVRDRSKRRTTRVSVSSGGAQGNGGSYDPAPSADGRFVAFSSDASNLVSGDTNRVRDVFVRDRSSGKTLRVSVSSDGRQANGASGEPAISADGAFIAFSSDASNLIPKDANRVRDVFVWERATGKTVRVSVTWKKAEANGSSHAPSMSSRGRIIAFHSRATNLNKLGDTNRAGDVFVRDRSKGETVRVSVGSAGDQANGDSSQPSLSADGSIIAFASVATNLNRLGDTNRQRDVFIRDRSARDTVRVSVSWKKAQANGASGDPAISRDGSLIAFSSGASNLNRSGDTNKAVDIFLRDRSRPTTSRVSVSWQDEQANGTSVAPAISRDGGFVAFASAASNLSASGDTNKAFDIFVRGPLD